MQRQTLLRKAEEVEGVRKLIEQYRVIGIADLHKVRAPQLQALRRKLRGSTHLRVVKNKIMERALAESGDKPNIDKLKEYLQGPNIFLFTNLNPFKLAMLLEKSKVKAIAKAGDVAAEDIIVPAGNTGLPPGPIISQLNAVGLPTRIEAGSVWINRDTLVAKKGEVISQRLAAVLSKLGIESVEVGLSLRVVYDDGLIIPEEELHIDLEKVKRKFMDAYTQAFNLSLNSAYPTVENVTSLIQLAHQQAYNLTMNASIITPESIVDLIRKAHIEAATLQMKLNL